MLYYPFGQAVGAPHGSRMPSLALWNIRGQYHVAFDHKHNHHLNQGGPRGMRVRVRRLEREPSRLVRSWGY